MMAPSFFHVILGAGLPIASHVILKLELTGIDSVVDEVVIDGGTTRKDTHHDYIVSSLSYLLVY